MADELGTSEIVAFDEFNNDDKEIGETQFFQYEDENSKNNFDFIQTLNENENENQTHDKTSQEYDLLRRKLFVGGLSTQTTEDTLKNYFSKYGEIEDVNLLKDRETGRSRCFGFLTFRLRESMTKALEEKHTIDNRTITVNFASPETPNKDENSIECEPSNKVYVGHLSKDITEEQIQKALENFGPVKSVLIIKNENEESRGYGFVMFESPESAKAAKDAGECTINGNTIQITRAVVRKGKKTNQNITLPSSFQFPGGAKTPITFPSLIPSINPRPPFNPINPFNSSSALPAIQQQLLQQQAAVLAARLQGLARPGLLPSLNPAFTSQNTNQQSQQQQSTNPYMAAMAAQYYGYAQYPRTPFVPDSTARAPFNPYAAAYGGYGYPGASTGMGYGNYTGYPSSFHQSNRPSRDRTGSVGSEKEAHEFAQNRHSSPHEQPHQDPSDLPNQNTEFNDYYDADYYRSKKDYNSNDEEYNHRQRSPSSNSYSDQHRKRSTSKHRHQPYRKKSRSISQGTYRKKNGGKRSTYEKERDRDRDRNYDNKQRDRDTRKKSRRY